MDVKELRLGNYVTFETLVNGYFRIDEISFTKDAGYYLRMYPCFPDTNSTMDLQLNRAKPIPLTEELLLKCGFIKSGDYVFDYKENYSDIVFDSPNDWNNTIDYPIGIDTVTHYMGDNPIIIRCLYLHQLQNMIFSITGEELDVKF